MNMNLDFFGNNYSSLFIVLSRKEKEYNVPNNPQYNQNHRENEWDSDN